MNRLFDKLPFIGGKVPGKITLSFLMLLFAFGMQIIYRTEDRIICTIAMIMSYVGDYALNHNPDHDKQTKNDFIVGAVAFIVAHIFYSMAYRSKIVWNCYDIVNAGFIVGIFLPVFATVAVIIIANHSNGISNKELLWLGIGYLWLTGVNYIMIFSYSVSAKSIQSLAALGGIMFFASDFIIGLEKFFGLKSKVARELVWWLYPIGQILLIAMA